MTSKLPNQKNLQSNLAINLRITQVHLFLASAIEHNALRNCALCTIVHFAQCANCTVCTSHSVHIAQCAHCTVCTLHSIHFAHHSGQYQCADLFKTATSIPGPVHLFLASATFCSPLQESSLHLCQARAALLFVCLFVLISFVISYLWQWLRQLFRKRVANLIHQLKLSHLYFTGYSLPGAIKTAKCACVCFGKHQIEFEAHLPDG